MISLAIDSSCAIGTLAVARAGTVVAAGRFGEHESHMREIGSAVDSILSRAGLRLSDVERIAFVAGPGSFTGLRIGLAFVKGLHAASGTPVVTINSLELLALPLLKDHALVLPMIDARKDQVYAALYGRSRAGGDMGAANPICEPAVAAPESFLSAIESLREYREEEETVICTGSGSVCYERLISERLGRRSLFAPPEMQFPSTDLLAVRAAEMTPVPEEALLALEPLYIRPTDAELKRLKEVRTGE